MKMKNGCKPELVHDDKSAALNVLDLTQKALSEWSVPKIIIADNGKGFAVNGKRDFLGGSDVR